MFFDQLRHQVFVLLLARYQLRHGGRLESVPLGDVVVFFFLDDHLVRHLYLVLQGVVAELLVPLPPRGAATVLFLAWSKILRRLKGQSLRLVEALDDLVELEARPQLLKSVLL